MSLQKVVDDDVDVDDTVEGFGKVGGMDVVVQVMPMWLLVRIQGCEVLRRIVRLFVSQVVFVV
jgi:hypothetical protein